ncbi:MAG: flavodoxin family protein [Candidatus Firestonebacteria bacterium]
MKVLGINASPRKGGNTDFLLDQTLKGAGDAGAETEKIYLNRLNYRGCQECSDALTDGNCKVKDDLLEVIAKVLEADAVVIASPVYFGSVSGQLKCMIDRFQCYWMGRFVHKTVETQMRKKGVFLSVQGTEKEKFFLNSRDIVKNFMATINAEYTAELSCKLVDAKLDIQKRLDCLEQAYKIGEKLI